MDTVDWGIIAKHVLTIWANASGNPIGALIGVLSTSLLGAVVYWLFKRWAKKVGQDAARKGEVIDRDEFIERESGKTEQKNEKDNAVQEGIKDLP